MRNHLLLLLVAVVVLPPLAAPVPAAANPLYPGYVLGTGPVIYWQFEEPFSNYTAADRAANAANPGSYEGIGAKGAEGDLGDPPAAGGTGLLGGAAVFTKGSWGGSTNVHAGHAINYPALSTTANVPLASYSVQMWFNSSVEFKAGGATNPHETLHYFFGRSHSDAPTADITGGSGWRAPDNLAISGFNLTFPRLRYQSFDGGTTDGSGDGNSATSATNLTDKHGQWHHVVFLRDGDDVSVYLNGQLEIATTDPLDMTTYSGENYSGQNFLIGHRPDYDYDVGRRAFGLTGLMDEVAVWDRPLTAAEVWNLYNYETIPEPGTFSLLLATGAAVLLAFGRRYRRK